MLWIHSLLGNGPGTPTHYNGHSGQELMSILLATPCHAALCYHCSCTQLILPISRALINLYASVVHFLQFSCSEVLYTFCFSHYSAIQRNMHHTVICIAIKVPVYQCVFSRDLCVSLYGMPCILWPVCWSSIYAHMSSQSSIIVDCVK